MKTDVIIIGTGPIGLFAIFQAGMLGMKCHVIEALNMVGGQCGVLYPEKPIYDIPAYPVINASRLIEQLEAQAAPFNPIYHLGQQAVNLTRTGDNFNIYTSLGTTLESKVIIIAAGCGSFGPNKPPLKEIETFEGKSVFYLVNKRQDFINKTLVIAGGGDSAVDWTISLAEVATKIYLVHRRNKFRASPESVRQLNLLAATGKVELVTGYQLTGLTGIGGLLESVEVSDLDGNSKILSAEILLPFFGLSQDLGPIMHWGLNLDYHNILVTAPHCETNIPGIYAIGDIANYPGKLKLILTGFAEAASALHHAYAKVFEGKALHFEYSTTKGVKSE